jgi:hypothetical protein
MNILVSIFLAFELTGLLARTWINLDNLSKFKKQKTAKSMIAGYKLFDIIMWR